MSFSEQSTALIVATAKRNYTQKTQRN